MFSCNEAVAADWDSFTLIKKSRMTQHLRFPYLQAGALFLSVEMWECLHQEMLFLHINRIVHDHFFPQGRAVFYEFLVDGMILVGFLPFKVIEK